MHKIKKWSNILGITLDFMEKGEAPESLINSFLTLISDMKEEILREVNATNDTLFINFFNDEKTRRDAKIADADTLYNNVIKECLTVVGKIIDLIEKGVAPESLLCSFRIIKERMETKLLDAIAETQDNEFQDKFAEELEKINNELSNEIANQAKAAAKLEKTLAKLKKLIDAVIKEVEKIYPGENVNFSSEGYDSLAVSGLSRKEKLIFYTIWYELNLENTDITKETIGLLLDAYVSTINKEEIVKSRLDCLKDIIVGMTEFMPFPEVYNAIVDTGFCKMIDNFDILGKSLSDYIKNSSILENGQYIFKLELSCINQIGIIEIITKHCSAVDFDLMVFVWCESILNDCNMSLSKLKRFGVRANFNKIANKSIKRPKINAEPPKRYTRAKKK